MSKLSIASLACAGLMAASPAQARTRSSRMPTISSRLSGTTPPSAESGTFSRSTTTHQTSKATCNATVSAETESTAKSALVSVYADMLTGYCEGFDAMDPQEMDDSIEAIAHLMLESKIKCTTDGKYAYACGGTWAGAESYAGAAYEAYAKAWATVQENHACSCGQELTADSHVSIAAWGDIWASVYSSLDDHACASSIEYDSKPSVVDQTKTTSCTAMLIYKVMAKATAGAWVSSECKNNKPARCEKCCLSPAGSYLPDCNCQEWTDQCNKEVDTWANATTYAELRGEVDINTASCSGNLTDEITKDVQQYSPVFTYDPTVNDACANPTATCTAFAQSKTFVDAVSAQADAVASITKDLCQAGSDTANDIKTSADQMAMAMVDVYAKASGVCDVSGACLDPLYDGGCAYAKVWVDAFSKACAEAYTAAAANVTFGTGADAACNCNLGGKAYASAIAHELEDIHAHVVQTVEAEACVSGAGHMNSDIARRCVAKSVAELYSKAVARVLTDNGCVTAKADYCKDECKVHSTHDPQWQPCIDECEQQATGSATAFVESIARITLTNDESCTVESFSGVYTFSETLSTTAPLTCKGPGASNIAMGVAIDESGSVGRTDFAVMTKAVGDWISDTTSTMPDTLWYAYTFDSGISPLVEGQKNTNGAVATKVHDAPFNGGGTHIGNALQVMHGSMKAECSNSETKCVGLLMTDGKSGDRVSDDLLNKFKSEVGDLVVVGVGSNTNVSELKRYASPGLYFASADFVQIGPLMATITAQTGLCEL